MLKKSDEGEVEGRDRKEEDWKNGGIRKKWRSQRIGVRKTEERGAGSSRRGILGSKKEKDCSSAERREKNKGRERAAGA